MNLGSFTLVEPIAEGGMGVVWKATHNTTGELAAVKILKGEEAQTDEFKTLLRQEVQATARFDHPNIVGIYDYGVLPEDNTLLALRKGDPYYAMEFVQALDVRDVAHDWSSIRDVLLSTLSGLAHAHARQVIHRDIKPENVMCTRQRSGRFRVVLTDFGIAHALERSSPTWSEGPSSENIEMIAGTPAYMAPEQAKGLFREYGPWTDLYALGVMAYELVCGRLPFQAKTTILLLTMHINKEFPALVPTMDIPLGLGKWIEKLVAKDPWDRFQSAAEARNALLELKAPAIGLEEDALSAIEMDETGRYEAFSMEALQKLDDETSSDVTSTDVPSTWSESRDEWLPTVWVPSGVGLLGLRTIPFVGRRKERDVLWKAFEDCVQSQSARAVVISGISGTGKSRLAQWLAETVREHGLAQTFEATHQPTPTDLDGLTGMMALHYRCAGMRLDDLEARVSKLLQVEGVHSEVETLTLTAVMKGAALVSEDDKGSDINLTPTQQVNVVLKAITRSTRRLPAVVLLDELQWGTNAVQLIKSAIDLQAPILFVATTQDEALDEKGLADRIRAIEAHPRTNVVQLGFFDRANTLKFVRQGLTLSGDVAQLVADRCGGSPLFASQLVCHWVETKQLVRSGGNMVLSVAAPSVPESITALWTQRLESFVAAMAQPRELAHGFLAIPAAPAVVRERLELAAALGLEFSESEWQGLCERRKLANVPGMLEQMAEAKLLVRREDSVAFPHSLLRDTIIEESKAGGRWRALNTTAATHLMTLYRSDHPGLARRVAKHFGNAESHELAVAALWAAFKKAIDTVDYAVIGELGEDLLFHMDQIPVPSSNPQYFTTQFWLGTRLVMQSAEQDAERGQKLIDAGLEAAENSDSPDDYAVMLSASGWARMQRGAIDEGLKIARQAVNLAVSREAQTQTQRGLAFLLGATNNFQEAAQYAAMALTSAERAIDVIRAHATLGHQLLHMDAFDEGRNQLIAAIDLCYQEGLIARASAALNSLGDLELKAGDYRAARDAYYKNLEIKLGLLADTSYAHAARCKYARALYFCGEFQEALKLLLEVREASIRGENLFFAHPEDGVLACAAALQNWDLFDLVFDDAFDLDHPGWIHRLMFESALRDLQAHGQTNRADDLIQAISEVFD